MRAQRFAPTRPEGVDRIFVIGESAVVGQAGSGAPPEPFVPSVPLPGRALFAGVRPLPGGPGVFPEAETLPARLQALLRARGRAVEVVNMGRIAQDSDGHLASVKEALALGATGIALYYGNNESLMLWRELEGQQVPLLEGSRSALRRLYLYRLLHLWLPRPDVEWETLRREGLERAVAEAGMPATVVDQLWTLANRPLVGVSESGEPIPEDIVQDAVVARFRRNLEAILVLTRAAGVPVWFVPCPPALHLRPFVSGHDPLAGNAARERAEGAVSAGIALLHTVDSGGEGIPRAQPPAASLVEALRLAKGAVVDDPGSAAGWHLLAVAEEANGHPAAATDAALRALALDQSHKRSTPAFAEVARALCAGGGCVVHDLHTELVAEARRDGPARAYLRFHSDYDHPLPAGHERLAEAFVALIDALPPGRGP
jgi:hypothetical protein